MCSAFRPRIPLDHCSLATYIPRLYARPGETIVVARSDKLIVLDGSVSPAVSLTSDSIAAKPATLWLVTYTAPPANDLGEVAIGYTVGTEKHNVIVQVSATPQPGIRDNRLSRYHLSSDASCCRCFGICVRGHIQLASFSRILRRAGRTNCDHVHRGWVVAKLFHQDFVGSLFDAYLGGATSNVQHTTLGTQFLTALVLAGGSASVNQLLIALNLREAKTAESVTEKAPPDKAWVAIRVLNISTGDLI